MTLNRHPPHQRRHHPGQVRPEASHRDLLCCTSTNRDDNDRKTHDTTPHQHYKSPLQLFLLYSVQSKNTSVKPNNLTHIQAHKLVCYLFLLASLLLWPERQSIQPSSAMVGGHSLLLYHFCVFPLDVDMSYWATTAPCPGNQ